MDALIENNQHIRFSGAGADHQNGVAKHGTQTFIQMGRTIMIHSTMRSP